MDEKEPRPTTSLCGATSRLQMLRANDMLGDDLPETADAVLPPVHVFFDIEAKQVDTRHVPNLLVSQHGDDYVFIGGTVTCAFESFSLPWRTGAKMANNR